MKNAGCTKVLILGRWNLFYRKVRPVFVIPTMLDNRAIAVAHLGMGISQAFLDFSPYVLAELEVPSCSIIASKMTNSFPLVFKFGLPR